MTVMNVGTDKYPVLEVDGITYPITFKPEVIRGVPEVTMRKDDVMLCGFPRSGTHWVFEIVSMLLQTTADTIPRKKEDLHVEQATDTDISSLPSPRVLNGHVLFQKLPKQVLEKKVKVIYLLRDPRDVAVSMYDLMMKYLMARLGTRSSTFSDWLKPYLDGQFPWGKWFDHVTNWERGMASHPDHPFLVVYYDDLISNAAVGIARIGQFLDVEVESSLCGLIAYKCQIDRMRQDKDHVTEKVNGDTIHYNHGRLGRWKSVFTEADTELFNRMFVERMEGFHLCDRYRDSDVQK